MPQMGVSVSEGTITKWLKQPGEAIARDEPLLEISTDKVDTEIPSEADGVLVFGPSGEIAAFNPAAEDIMGLSGDQLMDRDPIDARWRTVDEDGHLLPGLSAWAKDLNEGDAHRAPMNYNFRLTVARDPQYRVPIPPPDRYDPKRYALLAAWFRDQEAQGKPVGLEDILDLYPRRNGKFELNNKQSAIISLGHFGGQFDWPGASYEERARIYRDHLDYTLGLLHWLSW